MLWDLRKRRNSRGCWMDPPPRATESFKQDLESRILIRALVPADETTWDEIVGSQPNPPGPFRRSSIDWGGGGGGSWGPVFPQLTYCNNVLLCITGGAHGLFSCESESGPTTRRSPTQVTTSGRLLLFGNDLFRWEDARISGTMALALLRRGMLMMMTTSIRGSVGHWHRGCWHPMIRLSRLSYD